MGVTYLGYCPICVTSASALGLLRPTGECAPGLREVGTVDKQKEEGGGSEGGGRHVGGQRDLARATGHWAHKRIWRLIILWSLC